MNDGRGPDVLGLEEVENRKVIEMLVAKLCRWVAITKSSIRIHPAIAALIRHSSTTPKSSTWTTRSFILSTPEDPRHCGSRTGACCAGDDRPRSTFSSTIGRRGNDEWQRIMAATVLRKRLDEILAVDPKADFVLGATLTTSRIMCRSPSSCGWRNAEKAVDGTLYDTTAHLAAEGKGTLVYDDRWELIDHIIISPGLLDGDSFTWKSGSSRRLGFPELFFHPRARSDSPALKELLGKQLSQGRLFRPSGRVVHHQRLTARVLVKRLAEYTGSRWTPVGMFAGRVADVFAYRVSWLQSGATGRGSARRQAGQMHLLRPQDRRAEPERARDFGPRAPPPPVPFLTEASPEAMIRELHDGERARCYWCLSRRLWGRTTWPTSRTRSSSASPPRTSRWSGSPNWSPASASVFS